MRAQSQFMLRSHGRTSSDEFGCLRCVLYVRGGAVAASSQYLVLLGSPFEYLLEDVGPVVSNHSEARQSVLHRPSRFIPVLEARGVLGCFVERSLQMFC
jgi:hypothetical protein